jgi:hypothetical protein
MRANCVSSFHIEVILDRNEHVHNARSMLFFYFAYHIYLLTSDIHLCSGLDFHLRSIPS